MIFIIASDLETIIRLWSTYQRDNELLLSPERSNHGSGPDKESLGKYPQQREKVSEPIKCK